MKRMSDEELGSLWESACKRLSKGEPIPIVPILRAIESAAYERAAMACDELSSRAGTADEAADAIRAMAKGE